MFTIVVIAAPEQIVCDVGVAIALGVGFTVIVKVFDAPEQARRLVMKLPMLAGNTPPVPIGPPIIVLVATLITEKLLPKTFVT